MIRRLYARLARWLCWHRWLDSKLDGFGFCVHCGKERRQKGKK